MVQPKEFTIKGMGLKDNHINFNSRLLITSPAKTEPADSTIPPEGDFCYNIQQSIDQIVRFGWTQA